MEQKYYCPNCGHEFEQGEYDYNYDTAYLDFHCPFCDWEGNETQLEDENLIDEWGTARKLLRKKVNDCNFEDEMYELVFEKVGSLINDVEDELGEIDDDGTEMWYDEVRTEMMELLYERIEEWLMNNNMK